jgi:hypothetical protein
MRYNLLVLILISAIKILPGQPVFISPADSLDCEAGFTFVKNPDNILSVHFLEQSTGALMEYFWDFGDGTTSNVKNPSHAFPEAGNYQVCLTISKNDSLNPCRDSICKMIDVEDKTIYQLGGLLFAGDFPINNPHSTGDTGYAYLYRFEEKGPEPYDSIVFDTLGYYWFASVEEGLYCLKTGLTSHSARWQQFIPTYYGDDFLWYTSDTLRISYNIYNADVRLVAGTLLEEGTGRISGQVFEEGNTDNPSGHLPGGEVILANEEGIPFQAFIAGNEGEFLFDRIPYGNYQVFAEHTGKFSQRISLLLEPSNPCADSVNIHIYNHLPGINDNTNVFFSAGIYPIPSEDMLYLQLHLLYPQSLSIILMNGLGEPVLSESGQFLQGKFTKCLDVGKLPPGFYILALRGEERGTLVVKKIIKK